MSLKETVMFEKCPLCGKGNVTTGKTRALGFLKPKIGTCTSCSAEFLDKGESGFQLVHCEPHRLIGRHDCADRVFRGCYLDATLPKQEWEKISEGGESTDFCKFSEISKKFSRGTLPTYPSKDLPFTLEQDEVVHYISSPVFMNDQATVRRRASDRGDFYLTNKRVVFVRSTGALNISLGDVERVEDSPPGFLVQEKGSYEPLHFYPCTYDPVSAAMRGAIRNLKKKH